MSDVAAARISEVPVSPARLSGAERKARARAVMLEGPIVSTLLKMALPTIGVMVAQTAVGIAETYYVGFLGTDALAGVALVFPIFMLMTTMSNGGLGSGVASAVARAIGAGRQKDADALVFHSVVLAVLCGVLFMGGAFVGGPVLYRALGGQGEALHAAIQPLPIDGVKRTRYLAHHWNFAIRSPAPYPRRLIGERLRQLHERPKEDSLPRLSDAAARV